MAEQTFRLNSSLSDDAFKLSCNNLLSKLIRPEQSTIDSILSFDDPEKADIILPDGRKFVWYFAIGSMINPISLHLRDIRPLISYPARCPNHQLVFRGFGGMADIQASPESEFHGVVHLLSDEHMAQLDALEATYDRIPVNSINYQGQFHLVYIYKMNIQNQGSNLPSERYLDVITKGCEYFKVHPEYITRLRTEQAVTPRRQPHIFQSFTDIPSDVFYSAEELAQHNGSDPSLPLWVSINGKILEYTEPPPDAQPESEATRPFPAFLKARLGGRELTDVMSKGLYEPLYPLSADGHHICDEHRAAIEDDFYSKFNSGQVRGRWNPIGCLSTTNTLL